MRTLKRHGAGRGSIQFRVLAIALVPSVAIMVVGVALSVFLAYRGVQTQTFADNVREALGPSSRVITAVQEERRLTTLQLTGAGGAANGGDHNHGGDLAPQRQEVDSALNSLEATTAKLAESAPDELRSPLRKLSDKANDLPGFRQRVDNGGADVQQVYDFYKELSSLVGESVQGIAGNVEGKKNQGSSDELMRSSIEDLN